MFADGAPYPFAESATLYATWKWFCVTVNLTVSANRTGAGSANVTFSASDFYPIAPLTSPNIRMIVGADSSIKLAPPHQWRM